MEAAARVMVEAVGVAKLFGSRTALSDVTFAVRAGEVCGVLGPNGAGKTTLFRLLLGILRASAGVLRVDGLDSFADRVELKRRIGFVPDEPVFYSYLSGRETLELSASMHGLDPTAALARLEPLIRRLRLDAELDAFAEDLSRGTKKKLALLLALLHRPRLLVLDEPTNGLDVEASRLFGEMVREEARHGTTVLLSSHLMEHVARLCSRVVIIDRGAVIADDRLDALKAAHTPLALEEIFLQLVARRS